MIPKNGQIMGRFPCTPSGKIDSRALLDSLEIQTSSDLWTDLFSRTSGIPVGPLDNFFEMGGDSISVLSLISMAEKQGVSLSTTILQRHPSPYLLNLHHSSKQIGRRTDELDKYIHRASQHLNPLVKSNGEHQILLTGATGFWERLLAALCHLGHRVMRVLIRAKNQRHAELRLSPSIRDRVDIVVGDLCIEEDLQRFLGSQGGSCFIVRLGYRSLSPLNNCIRSTWTQPRNCSQLR